MSIFQELKRYCQYKQVCYNPKIRGEECACSYEADYRKAFTELPKCEESNCPFMKVLEKGGEALFSVETDPTDPCTLSRLRVDFALEKLERKSVEKKLLPGGFYVGYCPVCNLLLKPVHTSILDSDPGHKPNYCPDCGQHLEWEDK